MYSLGREVDRDLVAAHKWFNLAALRGNECAKQYRRDISSEMSAEEIAQAQADDEDLQAVYRSLSDAAIERPSWKDISHLGEACKFYNNEWSRLRLQTGLLYRLWESPDGLDTWRQLVIPRAYQQSILQGVHSTTVGSHQGFRRTWDFLRRRFFWFEMGKQLQLFIRTCIDCQKKKNMNVNPR